MYSVLLVDDEPLVLEGLRFMVDWQTHGFRICGEACDGEDALARIRELKPDLVVTDIRMPVIDGLQLIEQCHEETGGRCQFIILSGHEDFALARRALHYQVRNYWLKPIDADEIHETLRELRKEWERPRAHAAPIEAPLSVAAAGADARECEETLLAAIEGACPGDIREAARRLTALLEERLGEADNIRAYLSNLIPLLAGRVAEVGASAAGGSRVLEVGVPSSTESLRQAFTAFCLEEAERLRTERAKAGAAGEAARYVREHYSRQLKLQDVARELHFQPAYLGQLFKREFGVSFLDFLHRTRVEEAQRLLLRTDSAISDIARTVGYADPERFTAKFKRFAGSLPSRYKKS
ncbi:response regulator transcription factor [Cohnella boryungensis]|uniref:Response regulator n=1 Tax=Cohnella boryungensis TaxID=768479 RepID=A0ABV8SCN4_9BACL